MNCCFVSALSERDKLLAAIKKTQDDIKKVQDDLKMVSSNSEKELLLQKEHIWNVLNEEIFALLPSRKHRMISRKYRMI